MVHISPGSSTIKAVVDRRGQPPAPEEVRWAWREAFGRWAWLVAVLLATVPALVAVRPAARPIPTGSIVSAIGLALDIVGVLLLARGALMSAEDIARIGTHADLEGKDRRQVAIRLREEGRIGAGLAVIGFILQLAGSLLL